MSDEKNETFYPTNESERAAEAYRAAGAKVPWQRVYKNGVDITDTVPPEEWPWPFNKDAPRPKRARGGRSGRGR